MQFTKIILVKMLNLNKSKQLKQSKSKTIDLNQKIGKFKFSIRQKFHQQLRCQARKQTSHYNQLNNALQQLKNEQSLTLYRHILMLLQCNQWKQHFQLIQQSCLIDYLKKKLSLFWQNKRLFNQQDSQQHKILTLIFCCLTEKPQLLNLQNQNAQVILIEMLSYIQKYENIQVFFACLTATGNLIYFLNQNFFELLGQINIENQVQNIIYIHLRDESVSSNQNFLPSTYIPNFIWFLKAYFQTYQDKKFRPKFKQTVQLFALQQVQKISLGIYQEEDVILVNQIIGLLNLLEIQPDQIQRVMNNQDFITSLLKNTQKVLEIKKIECYGLILAINYAYFNADSILQQFKNKRLTKLLEFIFQNSNNINSVHILEIIVLYLNNQPSFSLLNQAVRRLQDFILQIYGSFQKAPMLKSRKPQLLAEFLIIMKQNSNEKFWDIYLQESCVD